jgi:hypothetical protein
VAERPRDGLLFEAGRGAHGDRQSHRLVGADAEAAQALVPYEGVQPAPEPLGPRNGVGVGGAGGQGRAHAFDGQLAVADQNVRVLEQVRSVDVVHVADRTGALGPQVVGQAAIITMDGFWMLRHRSSSEPCGPGGAHPSPCGRTHANERKGGRENADYRGAVH